MGLTYTQKPAFIDRMIEVGSHHFFKALGNLSLAAAEAENGENIGMARAAREHAQDAQWHMEKTIELYRALVESASGLPVSDRAREILTTFDYESLKRDASKARLTLEENEQWTQFVSESRRGDPVAVIKSFVAKLDDIRSDLAAVTRMIESGKMDAKTIHRALSSFVRTMTFGQYIAEFNRTSREKYARG
jgi:hypothetical protein